MTINFDVLKAGSCLFKIHGRVGDGLCRLAGNAFSTSFPQGCNGGQGYSQQGNLGKPFCLQFLVRILSSGSCALLKINLREPTQRDHSPQVGNSPASHGSRGCCTSWMGNHDIYCTLGLACSAWFVGDWPWSPHFVPPFCTKGSRLHHQSSEGH